ncbi:MAG: LytTR family DNA-binding domain-containing protein [Bacteroidota bacterium]
MIAFLQRDFPFLVDYRKALRIAVLWCSLGFLFVLFTGPLFVQPKQKASSLAFIVLFMIFNSQMVFRLLIPLCFKKQFSERHWTVGKEIIWMVLELLFGIALCYVLLLWIWDVPESSYRQGTIKNSTVLFMGLQFFIIPLSVYIKREMVLQNYLEKAKTLNMLLLKKGWAGELPKDHQIMVQLDSNDGNENLELKISDILFLKGAHNYVEVYYFSNNQLKRSLLRNTLKSLFKDVERFESFVFCHRSYIINIQQVASINGNSRGYKVLLKGYDEFIPVSRQKATEFEIGIKNRGVYY